MLPTILKDCLTLPFGLNNSDHLNLKCFLITVTVNI